MFRDIATKKNLFRLVPAILVGALLALTLSCSDDNFDSTMALERLPVETVLIKHAPVPGNGGIITIVNVAGTGVTLLWERATDDVTPQVEIEYRLVWSEDNNISTAREAVLNGIIAMDWTPGVYQATVAGLMPNTTSFFNVIARDGDGMANAYNTVSATTTREVLFLFSAGRLTGNLFSRARVDARCQSVRTATFPGLPDANVRAFTSMSATDSLARMPLNYGVPNTWPVVGPTGSLIADSWGDLFDHGSDPLLLTLFEAGIADYHWWSHSETDGSYVDFPYNCNGHTDGTGSFEGWGGAHDYTGEEWLVNFMGGGEHPCDEMLHLLCVCWE